MQTPDASGEDRRGTARGRTTQPVERASAQAAEADRLLSGRV